jgi:predicted permease
MHWLRRLFRRSGIERELDRELHFHLDQQISDNLADGVPPEQARRDALIKLGGIERVKEEVRDTRWETHIDNFVHDFRYAIRNLHKEPRLALTAMLTLALGIGSATMIFSVIDCVLLHPFPYENVDRMASISVLAEDQQQRAWRFPVAAFVDFKEQNHTFDDMFGLVFSQVLYEHAEGTDEFEGGWVTPDTFTLLGIEPLLGRAITPEDANPGSPPVFVMSYKLWTTHFHRDPKILGSIFILNRTPMTLVSIMPPRFRFGQGLCEVWIPLRLTRDTIPPGSGIEQNEVWTVGHLKHGVSPKTAAADLEVIGKRLEKTYPLYFPTDFRLRVNAFNGDSVEYYFRGMLFGLMAAGTLLLLIACSNVANLLLARATTREKEIVIRAALGATRARLIRQLLLESFVLAVAGCALGYAIAYLGLKGVAVALPEQTVPSEVAISLNSAALLFALAITLLTTVICGLAPALYAIRRDLQGALTASGKNTGVDFRHANLRSGFIVAEVTFSVVLLIGSGLMMRTLLALEHVDIGFDATKVLHVFVSLPEGRYSKIEQKKLLYQRMIDRITQIPGVIAAANASAFPPYTWGWTTVVLRGESQPKNRNTAFVSCSEAYFQVLERRLSRGRLLSQNDVGEARRVAVVNQTFARGHFNNKNPIGQSIRFSDLETLSDWPLDPYFEIIGVIEDAKNSGLQEPPRPEVYLPYTLTADSLNSILVRSAVDPDSILSGIRREVAAIDSDIALADPGTIEQDLEQSYYASPKFTFVTLSAFAVSALLLVAVGVFSVISYTVARQTHEIGIRMALGAEQAEILRMVVKKGMGLIMTGVIIGLFASYCLTRLLASQIWGVSATDPWTFGAVAILDIFIGLMACLLPARRATKVSPVVALRYE